MNQYEHIDELIAKHLAEETSAMEEELISNWIASSETNSMRYSEMKMIHEASERMPVQDKIDVDRAWNAFSKKLQQPADEKPILTKLTLAFYTRAAIFICMLGLGYFIYGHLKGKENIVVFSSPDAAARNGTLPDRTFVSLYPKSSVTYSSSFNDDNRELTFSGEAYFNVQHQTELPFIIKTGNVFIKDIGTSFTVKALPSDSTVTVHVTEGEVIFYSTQNSGITLIKNETGIYNLLSQTFRKKNDESPLVSSQSISFENTKLRLVIDTLNKVYNEHILLSCKKLESLELTAAFKENTAAPIVETIAETFGLSITRTNGTTVLNGEDCKE